MQVFLRTIRVATYLILSGLLLPSCFQAPQPEAQISFTLPTTISGIPLTVGTNSFIVDRGPVARTFIFEGTVQAVSQQDLYFNTDGRVASIPVESGDLIYPGDLVAELETEDSDLDMAEAELRVQLAELRVQQVQDESTQALEVATLALEAAVRQLEKLQADPSAPTEDLEAAQHQVRLAEANLNRLTGIDGTKSVDVAIAEKELELSQLALERVQHHHEALYLRAPMTGNVWLSHDLGVGLPVQAYASVARIAELESLLIEGNLASDDLELLREGMDVSIESTSLPTATLTGTLVLLPPPYGSGNSPFVQIDPHVNEGNNALREGASVLVKAELEQKQDVIRLPNNVIQHMSGRSYVVLREGDQLRGQEVATGLVGDSYTEIMEGLTVGVEVLGP